jgi:hypothetical protein
VFKRAKTFHALDRAAIVTGHHHGLGSSKGLFRLQDFKVLTTQFKTILPVSYMDVLALFHL